MSVVIVTYRSADVIGACLDTLRAALPDADVVVVDNASPDETRAIVARHPDVRLLARPRNEGFASAMNRGVAVARGAITILLNPDARLTRAAAETLVRAVARDPTDVVVGPQLRNEDGSVQRSAFRFPGAVVTLLEQLALGGRLAWLDPGPDDGSCGAVDWLKGACLVARTEVFLRLGPFDRGFLMFGEDVDLGVRLALSGGRSVYCPAAMVTHLGGTSTRHAPDRMALLFFAGTLRLSRLHRGPWRRAALAAVIAWISGVKILAATVRSLRASPAPDGRAPDARRPGPRVFARVGAMAVDSLRTPRSKVS